MCIYLILMPCVYLFACCILFILCTDLLILPTGEIVVVFLSLDLCKPCFIRM